MTQESQPPEPGTAPRRPIRSFVIRSGRMTEAQRKAFDTHMRLWALPADGQPADLAVAFGNHNPVTLEIGFGMGDSLAEMAQLNPQQNFLGVEVHPAGVGRLLALVDKHKLSNVRVYCHDAVEVLRDIIPAHTLARVNIYFPDPWHKTRHHKRRLIQPDFLTLLRSRMQAEGLLHIATDWQGYAQHVLKMMSGRSDYRNVAGPDLFVKPEVYGRPETKFERRGVKLGHGVWDMVFTALA